MISIMDLSHTMAYIIQIIDEYNNLLVCYDLGLMMTKNMLL